MRLSRFFPQTACLPAVFLALCCVGIMVSGAVAPCECAAEEVQEELAGEESWVRREDGVKASSNDKDRQSTPQRRFRKVADVNGFRPPLWANQGNNTIERRQRNGCGAHLLN